jgi:succinate-semialdehyde dehydrogenase/glutarate-semialdehyde dehydrogenase
MATKTQSILSINPANGEVLRGFDEASDQQVEQTLANAEAAFQGWRRTPFSERSRKMADVGAVLRRQRDDYARLITLEMGKPIAQSEAEIDKCAWNCDYYAENAERFLADEPMPSNARESYVEFPPLGTVLAIMPWNFPFWQLFRFAAPALMAGNTAILKHASNVPQCALAIEEVFREAGFPDGIFRNLLLSGARTGRVLEDSRIKAVTLTGSDATGSKIAEQSGRLLKKTVLELGGSDPFIVLHDADVEHAAAVASKARFQNSGQSCIAAKRFIIEAPVFDAFVERFTAEVKKLKVGDPSDRSVDVGPLAREDLVDGLQRQVDDSIKEGARALTGARRRGGRGFFYEPTVLSSIKPNMRVFREETFGTVAAVIKAGDEADAIKLANDTPFGLGANLWTRDLDRARRLAPEIEAGMVFINGMVASDPRLPFGGVKRSGFGRELSHYGIKEFVNVQTVWVGPAQSSAPPARTAE